MMESSASTTSLNNNNNQHHCLRSLNLSNLLQDQQPPASIPKLKINRQNVQNLIESYTKLNYNEKLLFLVGINNGGGGHNGGDQERAKSSCSPMMSSTPTPTTPTGSSSSSSSSSSRLSLTTTWLLSNFTPDNSTALPKEEVYDFYVKTFHESKPISTADFGKLMRQVFPDVKARRLGQRGASKYCYANIRKKSEFDIEKPKLSEIKLNTFREDFLSWGKQTFNNTDFHDVETLLGFLKSQNFKLPRKRRCSSAVGGGSSGKRVKKEDEEIASYLDNNSGAGHDDHDDWPQLRSLLSDKKRHCSEVETNKFSVLDSAEFRSASVPIFERSCSIISNNGNLNGNGGNNGIISRSIDSGYESCNNTPVVMDTTSLFNTPLLSDGFHVGGEDEILFDSVFDLIVADNQGSGGGSNGGHEGVGSDDFVHNTNDHTTVV